MFNFVSFPQFFFALLFCISILEQRNPTCSCDPFPVFRIKISTWIAEKNRERHQACVLKVHRQKYYLKKILSNGKRFYSFITLLGFFMLFPQVRGFCVSFFLRCAYHTQMKQREEHNNRLPRHTHTSSFILDRLKALFHSIDIFVCQYVTLLVVVETKRMYVEKRQKITRHTRPVDTRRIFTCKIKYKGKLYKNIIKRKNKYRKNV